MSVDDVVAETYLVAWRRFDQVPEDPSKALFWLYRVALYATKNSCRGDRRRQVLRDRLRSTTPTHGSPNLSAGPLEDETDQLASAFASLSEDDRTVLLLAAWEGLTGPALATVLECSVGAATTRLSRARSRFKLAVDGPDDHELEVGEP